ncbi:MAG: hypothetical protein RLN69_13940 [Woeseiaceae bacterium]
MIGRLVRLGFGVLCLWYVSGLIQISDDLVSNDGRIRPLVWNGVLFGLFLVSYVVNIGYSRAWKKWPAAVCATAFAAVALFSYLTAGTVETNLIGRSVWLWELYIFSHLGLAFIISGVIGTPGCEMRAFHDVFSRITGVVTKEHYCPVGPLHPIDQWERRRSQG